MLKRNLIIAVIFISVLFAVRASAQNATVQTFQNTAAITINDNGNASLYPSNIVVSGVSSFTRMQVRLNGFSHTYPDDVDIILVGPNGQKAILMSDAGGNPDVTNLTLTFSQEANSPLPDSTTLTTGNFRPTNYINEGGVVTDNFPAPGPGLLTEAAADLGVFNGTNPNGFWNLYVVDDASGDVGSISGGWTLSFIVPQIFTVTKTADTNDGVCNADCSLREALALAQDGDLINFSTLFNTPQTINLLTALPDINRAITINGTGANLLTVRRDFNAATDFRIFTIPLNVVGGVAISGMTITGGRANQLGGAILSQSYLMLTDVHVTGNTAVSGGGVVFVVANGVFTNCTFSNNLATGAAGYGGGIVFEGSGGHTLQIINSTLSGNRSNNVGGGIANLSGGGNSRLEITNSTITNNTAVNGGGILTFTQGGGTAATTLRNTIVTGNLSNNLATQANGGAATFQTLGFNLSDNYNSVFTPLGTDITTATPRLAPLALYGGQTPTHALLHASPAINAGDASGQITDQRGVARPATLADIGAVEIRPFVVTNDANSGAGSLRNTLGNIIGSTAINDIQFENGFFSTPRTITLTTGELAIFGNANLIAPGANLLTISGNNNSRVFEVSNTITATLSGMTITGGNSGASGDGGGIRNDGNLIVTNSTISSNTSSASFRGGGISNNGNLTLTNSTVSGNTAGQVGGSIHSNGNSTIVNDSTISGNAGAFGGGIGTTQNNITTFINRSTITNNSALLLGSGVHRVSGSISIRNSIIAGNVNNSTISDVSSEGPGISIISNGFNFIGNPGNVTFNQTGDQSGTGASPLNPQLGPLQNNGGATFTHALLANSPALDKGNSSGATSDQRGLTRPIDLAGITNVSDGADIGAFEAQTAPAALSKAPFDYDGDNKTDISIFRPAPGEWWINRSTNNSTIAFQFGTSTDKIVPADFTGDGKTDIAFWRPSTGQWFVLRSEDSSFFAFPFGANGDVPVPADYDGDGKADAAVFRPSNTTWFIQKSSGGTDIIGFGAAGDKPVVADYDGDRKADIAIFRPVGASGSEWWIRRSSNGSVFALQFGLSTDKPVQGDYTGDGKADIAFWRPSNGNWFVLRSEDFSFFAFPFGANGDTPVAGDYDGDGKFDSGVFRPSNTTWFIQRSTAGTLIQQFGANGDLPTPNAFVP